MWLSIGGSNKQNNKRPRYRSARSVQRARPNTSPPPPSSSWTAVKLTLACMAALVLGWSIVVPALLLEYSLEDQHDQHHGLHSLLRDSHLVKSQWNKFANSTSSSAEYMPQFLQQKLAPKESIHTEEEIAIPDEMEKESPISPSDDSPPPLDLARGVAGLDISQTPALMGAKKGTIQCDIDVNDLAYWNHPQGTRDIEFKSPFRSSEEKFLTFEADSGGWNNIRMSMEIIFVLAAATGRTLVLPPKAPFYLLGTGKENAKSFGTFFSLNHIEERIKVMTMQDFCLKHGEQFDIKVDPDICEMCVYQKGNPRECEVLYKQLREQGVQPPLAGGKQCLVFDQDLFAGKTVSNNVKQRAARFCGDKRSPVYYDAAMHDPEWLHWDAGHMDHRLLNHFYSFMYFTNPVIDNYYKRFVRDYLHYTDEIYCAAGKIVHSLQKEAPSFSTLHIRRGDFQFKEARVSADDWYNNTKEVWKDNELLYIATDERNKTWFEPLRRHYKLKFLDDYWDMAGLGELDKSFLGMIDTIVASHGRAFAGTWFSSFTGYINRMRGYNGKSMQDSWYSYPPRKTRMHTWEYPNGNYPAREWPIGWVGIDGDEVLEHERILPDTSANTSAKVENGSNRHVSVPLLSELEEDVGFNEKRTLARGVAGLPMSLTPALEGASRAHIECDVNVDSLAYWNSPQGSRDLDFKSPFAVEGDTKYLTFTPDQGGWNNIRMSMEIIFIFAALSGRTLVLPPEMNLYLLNKDKGKKSRSFADFFPLKTTEFRKRVSVISTEEFIRREGGSGGRLPIPESNRTQVMKSAKYCVNRKKNDNFCGHVGNYLASVGYVPPFQASKYCVVFDKDVYEGREIKPQHELAVHEFCGERRVSYWDAEFKDPVLVHFRADEKQYRLLAHFYGMLFFTDPAVGNYFSRFVRDFLHYHDSIYCAAGKIVKALQVEGKNRGFAVDSEGGGGYSSMHIRRGDFQYKKVKLPAEQWYENTKEIWKANEILFIATDERNKTWFDPIAKHHTLRFLDDYWEMAGLGDLDPNYMGMIDTIVASRARAFAGTWFSTFTGYINRMRGYHGMTMKDSWYSFLDRKTAVHQWKNDSKYTYAYEWPTGWIGIDGDVNAKRDKF